MLGRHSAVAVSLAFLAFASAQAAPSATDRSLTVRDYMDRGMPAPDRAWNPTDYTTASEVLGKLTPDQLPRSDSSRSAPFMNRIVNPENLELCTGVDAPRVTRMNMCGAYMKSVLGVANLYLAAMQRDHGYDDDTLDLTSLILRVAPVVAHDADEMLPTLDKDDPNYATRMDGYAKMKHGFASMMEGSLISLTTERNLYSDAARTRLAAVVGDCFTRMSSFLEPLTRSEIEQKLRKIAQTDPSPDVRGALAAFAQKP